MLEPDVLDYILNSLSVHKQLQESIIRDIVRRIAKGGLSPADNLTETAAYQAEILQKAGIVYDDIVKLVAESSDALYYDIKTAFDSAEFEIFNFDDEVLLSNGYEPETVKNLSPEMKQMWEASLSKTFTEAENLTKTIALTSQNAYISACDLAHMQVASGSFTYSQAIANAAKQASIQGTKVLYASGAVANLDYAVRRSVLTGVNQTAANLMFSKAQEMEHDLMQTTAHYGARPEHSLWQGCVVSLSGRAGYHSLDYVGYGTVTGIFGANCKHNWYLYFGFSPYTPEMLEDMKNKTVTADGKEMPMYDALQKQRRLERSVKATKRELVGLDEAMKNVSAKDAGALKAEFQAGAVRLKRQEARIANFCKQTGLKRDRFREQVFSAETEDGIKRWTKSVSQNAVMANRRALTSALKKNIINIIPDADNIVISPAKFTGYALNPDKDANKAKAFKDALGYTVGTADKLIDNIKSNIKKFDAVEKPDNGYGRRYEILMELTGLNGKKANVKTAWIKDNKTGETRLTSAYVTKKKFKEN